MKYGITVTRMSNTCGFLSHMSLLYNLGFSSNRPISCNCLSRHWLLSKQNKSLVMNPEDIEVNRGEKRLLAVVSRDLRTKEKPSNQHGVMAVITSTFLLRGWLCVMSLKNVGGSLNSSAICS